MSTFEKLIGKKAKYDKIFFCDTETTGLLDSDESGHLLAQCIEVAAVVISMNDSGEIHEESNMDEFVKLPEGKKIPEKIVEITNITDKMLEEKGISENQIAQMILKLIENPEKTLFCSHNVNFDIRFLADLMRKTTESEYPFDSMDILDTLTVASDRKLARGKSKHKLAHLIEYYGLTGKVVNTHRAVDDTRALVEVARAMDVERADLHAYINFIGYHAKYGIAGDKPIARFTYVPMNERYYGHQKVGVTNTIPYNYKHADKADKADKKSVVPSRNGKIKLPTSPILNRYLTGIGYDKEALNREVNLDEKDIRKVTTMIDSDKFIDRVVKAVTGHENITIYGDYDCDGICGSAVAVRVLRLLGAEPNVFINHRFNEGYGLNVKGMSRLIKEYSNTSLIITLDNGISARDGIAFAKSQGIDVVVSDHHPLLEGLELPDCPVVDEWRSDEDEHARECICGAELIRRLLVEVANQLGRYKELEDEIIKTISYSGCATMADSVPMTPANHYIGKLGLRQMRSHVYPCWNSIDKHLSDEDVLFTIAPMINASSRMTGESKAALDYLLADSKEDALKYKKILAHLNYERKKTTAEYMAKAIEEVEANGWQNDRCIVYKNDELPDGIAGLIAAQLVERYRIPAIALTKNSGSGRSIGNVNIVECLKKCSEYLTKLGGHAMACGVGSNMPDELRNKMNTVTPFVVEDASRKPVQISVKEASDIHLSRDIEKLQPFGPGFERPMWAIKGSMEDYEVKKDIHSKFRISNGSDMLECMMFNRTPGEHESVEAIGGLSVNYWRGDETPQLKVEQLNF